MSVRKSEDSRQVVVYGGNSKFIPIGQKFFMQGDYSSIYVPVEAADCNGCGMITECDVLGWADIPNCEKKTREDGKSVVFKRLT